MTLTTKRAVGIGCAVFLVSAVILFPARVAYRMMSVPQFSLATISGTVWKGRASAGSIGGVYLQNIEWRMRPLGLFTASLQYRLNAESVPGFLQTDVTLSANGTVTFVDTRASLPLHSFVGNNWMSGLSGVATANLSRVRLSDGFPDVVAGLVTVSDLILPKVHASSLGGYQAEFFTQESGITATIEDEEGIADVAGTLTLLTDRSFAFLAKVVPTTNTPETIRRRLPPANERGQHEVRLEGVF